MSQPDQKPPQSDLVEEEPTSSLMKINIPFPEEKGEVNLSDNYDSAKHIARGTSSIEDPSNLYDDESEGNSSSSSSFGAGVSESKLSKILKQYRDQWQREDQRMMTTVAQSIFSLKFKQNFERDVETLQMRMNELKEKISIADVVQNELETLHIEIKRAKFDKLDLNLEMSELQNRFNNVLGKVTEFEPEVQTMKNQVLMFKESLEIQNALDMQDHIDRERIALYGSIKNNESQPHFDGTDDGNMMSQQKGVSIANGGVALNLINTCLSCSGQQHILQKAFKLACIYYKPSKVEYQGQKYDRHSLIMQKSRLLDKEYKPQRKEDQSLLKQAEVLKDLLSSAQKRRTVLRSSLLHQSQTSLKNDQVLQERSMVSERTGIDTQHIRFKSSERLLSAQSTDHYQTQSFRNRQISPVQKKETIMPEIISMKNFMQRTQRVPNLSKEVSSHRIVLDDMNSRNEGQETLELPKVRKIVASTMLRTARAPTSHLQDMDYYFSQKQIQGPLPQVRPEISLSVIQRQKELISKRLVNMSALSSTRQKRLAQDSSYASIKDQLYNGTNVYMNPYASKQQIGLNSTQRMDMGSVVQMIMNQQSGGRNKTLTNYSSAGVNLSLSSQQNR
ncbi:hypothetical protein FGO68_gene5180 [Halteria grandinella]|uniref:Uncharacterized protein n=1 Tax=Halteria grandinella TaxID=5974 RepID=A0A8J8P4R2_HALGN|nr:hypothetical protein FGO68_gene5180 [Halteria grandinella]